MKKSPKRVHLGYGIIRATGHGNEWWDGRTWSKDGLKKMVYAKKKTADRVARKRGSDTNDRIKVIRISRPVA